jgi:small subunit ribosomal protein S14
MASQNQIEKSKHKAKFSTRNVNRCQLCGRRHGYISFFGLCRICFRNMAHKGELPGVVKGNN